MKICLKKIQNITYTNQQIPSWEGEEEGGRQVWVCVWVCAFFLLQAPTATSSGFRQYGQFTHSQTTS